MRMPIRARALFVSAVAVVGLGVMATSPSAIAVPHAVPSVRTAGAFPGEGTYRVGSEIKPGTYVSSPSSSMGGYWERLKCATGDLDCILANDNVEGQAFVTVLASDKYFSTSRMNAWRPASTVRPARPATRFAGDGTYRVGVDIAPGTYRSSPTDSLGGYWQRLSCVTGVLDCILANDNVEGRTIVTLLPTDKYFGSSRMRTWVKAG